MKKCALLYSQKDSLVERLTHLFKKNEYAEVSPIQVSYDDINYEKLNGFDLIFIHNHLEAEGITHPGLEVARVMRSVYKIANPIVILHNGDISLIEYSAKDNYHHRIIYSPGLKIINNVLSESELSKVLEMKRLTQAVLTDISKMLADKKGYIFDKITHLIQFKNSSSVLQNVLNEIEKILKKLFDQRDILIIEYEKYKNELINSRADEDKNEFEKLKNELLVKCKNELSGDTINRNTQIKDDERLKVLVVDDNPDWESRITELLGAGFEVIFTSYAEEAMNYIIDDRANKISGVIADWRLYKDYKKQEYWQEYQGYEVLRVAASSGSRALIAFTSLYGEITHEIRNQLNIDVTLIKKELIEQAIDEHVSSQIFRNIVRDKCLQKLKQLGQPSSEAWKRPTKNKPYTSLQKQYFAKKSSNEWDRFEKKISERADDVYEYYKVCLGNEGYSIDSLEPINEKFNLKYKTAQYDLESFLVLRRIWLALWFNHNKINLSFSTKAELTKEKVYAVLHCRDYNYYEQKAERILKTEMQIPVKKQSRNTSDSGYKSKYKTTNAHGSEEDFVTESSEGIKKSPLKERILYLLRRDAKQLHHASLFFSDEDLVYNKLFVEEIEWLKKHGIDPRKGAPDYVEDDKKDDTNNIELQKNEERIEKLNKGKKTKEIEESLGIYDPRGSEWSSEEKSINDDDDDLLSDFPDPEEYDL